LVARLGRHVPDAVEDRPCLGGQEQAPGPAVGRVGSALDPSRLLHAVDLPDQRHRPDLQQIGEASLVDALVAGEIAEGTTLRPGPPPDQAWRCGARARSSIAMRRAISNRLAAEKTAAIATAPKASGKTAISAATIR